MGRTNKKAVSSPEATPSSSTPSTSNSNAQQTSSENPKWQRQSDAWQYVEGWQKKGAEIAYCIVEVGGKPCGQPIKIRREVIKRNGERTIERLDNSEVLKHLKRKHPHIIIGQQETVGTKTLCPFCSKLFAHRWMFGHYSTCTAYESKYCDGWSKGALKMAEDAAGGDHAAGEGRVIDIDDRIERGGGWSVYLFRLPTEHHQLKQLVYIGKTEDLQRRLINHRSVGPISRFAVTLHKSNQQRMQYAVLVDELSTDCASWLEAALLLVGIAGRNCEMERTTEGVLLNTFWEINHLRKGMIGELAAIEYSHAVQRLHLGAIKFLLSRREQLQWTDFEPITENDRRHLPMSNRNARRKSDIEDELEQTKKRMKELEDHNRRLDEERKKQNEERKKHKRERHKLRDQIAMNNLTNEFGAKLSPAASRGSSTTPFQSPLSQISPHPPKFAGSTNSFSNSQQPPLLNFDDE